MKEAKSTLLMLAGTTLLILVAGLFFGNGQLQLGRGGKFVSQPTGIQEKNVVAVGGVEVKVDIADTQKERAQGLSGVAQLGEDEGKLFVFDKPSEAPFWMKDMLIPIDIIWIADGKIIGIEESVQPPAKGTSDADLRLYAPPRAVDYVLEVNGGFSAANGIGVGDEVVLP